MKYNYNQKEKEWDLSNIIKGNSSSYTKNNIYYNIQKNINKFGSSRYKSIKLNDIFFNKGFDNNDLIKNINNLEYNLNKSKDNNNNSRINPPNIFNSFEYKDNRYSHLNSLEKIINNNIIENKVEKTNIQEYLIDPRNKIRSENIKRNNLKIIDGSIFDTNSQEERDIIDYFKKKKFYRDNDRRIMELIRAPFQELKDKLVVKEKNIIELNNKIKEYKENNQKYENKIDQLNEKIDEMNARERGIKKEMEEIQAQGRKEIDKIKSELNEYIDENIKIKQENKILSMKNKILEEEIKESNLKTQSQEKVNKEEIMTIVIYF